MAEVVLSVALSPLLGVIFDKLSSLILKKFNLTCGINEDIKKFSSSLSTIRAVLQDAEERQSSEAAIIDWLGKLKDAAYEANDIVDEWATEALIVLDSRDCIQVGLSFLKHLKLLRKIAKRIKKVVARFDSISAEREEFHFKESVLKSAVGELMQQRETISVVCEQFVYGRDDDKEKMINILLSNAKGGCNLQVYPIVGIGGLGKTTLAQVIYNEKRVLETFKTRIWVCVSEDFSVKRLTKMIIASLSTEECKHEDLDRLQKRIKELLSGKKFLLVLDDVWNDNQGLWEKFVCSLRCGANGSSIIVTTRQPTVATIMGARNRYDLKPLADEFCWALFKARAFGMEPENESLEAIGKQIVEKCRGVPLVAKALGGTLRFERDEIKWNSVRDSEIWELKQDNDVILRSLRLCYIHLPSHMRQLFVYCSIYPKDYDISVKELIQLWMANEFLKPDGKMELEDIGSQIFNQLVLRSFLQDVQKNGEGKLICKMHDLMHDLACFVARNECYAFVSGNNIDIVPKTIRHLSIGLSQFPTNFVEHLSKSHPLLHTVLDNGLSDPQMEFFFKNLIYLRAFRTHSGNLVSSANLPRSLGKLKHLRYLDISGYHSFKLPKFICNLRNLQTLKLRSSPLTELPKCINKLINLRHLDLSQCVCLKQLPIEIVELINLRHLDLGGCDILGELPVRVGKLINLRHLDLGGCDILEELPVGVGELINIRHLILPRNCSLGLVRVGKLSFLERLENFVVGTTSSGHSIKELRDLNHLQGSLNIFGLENVRNGVEGKQANLAAKKNLSSLTLQWRGQIWNGHGVEISSWISNFALNLVEMTLDSYGRNNVNVNGNGNSNGDGEEDVLKALQPPLNLSGRLCINGYRGSKFQSWINNLMSLAEIELSSCSKCEDLPALGHLPLLKILRIERMDSLIRINKQFYGINSNQVFFPSLESLKFYYMPNWEEWEDLDHKQVFPCLRELVLVWCLNLASLPSAILCSVQNFKIESCEKIRSLPSMPCLRVLIVDNLIHLNSLSQSLQHLSSLHTLDITNCPELELSVGDFQHLLALKFLKLERLPKLTSLPDLHHRSTLHALTLVECKNLTELPQRMQNLTPPLILTIERCHHDLHLRCKKDEGEYWPYISRIPILYI